MDMTKIRRMVADAYLTYAILLKVAYGASFVLLFFEYRIVALILISTTLVFDAFTDGFIIVTIRRSRIRLRGLRIFIFKLSSEVVEQLLEESALDFAARGGNLAHWEHRFALMIEPMKRIGHKCRGKGRLFDYLPRDDKRETQSA